MDIIPILIALLAVVISVVSLVRTRKTSQKQLELGKITADLAKKQLERIVKEEESIYKAKLSVKIQGQSPIYSLVIRNIGNTKATNINVKFIDNEDSILLLDKESKLPLKELRPSHEKHLRSAKGTAPADPIQAVISWENIDGKQYEESVLISW